MMPSVYWLSISACSLELQRLKVWVSLLLDWRKLSTGLWLIVMVPLVARLLVLTQSRLLELPSVQCHVALRYPTTFYMKRLWCTHFDRLCVFGIGTVGLDTDKMLADIALILFNGLFFPVKQH
jgi:hypothetical protein